jgi:hypothetical protein
MIDTKLYPYEENPTCPKCRAINLNNADVDQGYDLIVQASDNNKHKVAFFDAHYCSGGKPIEEERKVPTLGGMVEVTDKFNCAGVTEEHLHRRCGNCHYGWLSVTADADRKTKVAAVN